MEKINDSVDAEVNVDVEKQTQQLETAMEVIDDTDVDADVEKKILQHDKDSSPYAGADIRVDNGIIDAVAR